MMIIVKLTDAVTLHKKKNKLRNQHSPTEKFSPPPRAM
jgi:hypothetical protein